MQKSQKIYLFSITECITFDQNNIIMETKTIPKTVKIPLGLYKKLENEMKKKKVSSFHKLMLMKLWE